MSQPDTNIVNPRARYYNWRQGTEMPGGMALYGQVSTFNNETDDWMQYIERLDYYFVANGIEDTTKYSTKSYICYLITYESNLNQALIMLFR